jgi:predicted nucleic acid-binding protein
MDWVLDPSLALAWGLPDETSKRADRFLMRTSRRGVFWVPALWWYEISNTLTIARRRQRLSEADVMRLVELYGALPIHTDAYLGPDVLGRFHALAQEYALSAYDAAYLELAQRRGLGLATLDRRLITAAKKAGIRIIRL